MFLYSVNIMSSIYSEQFMSKLGKLEGIKSDNIKPSELIWRLSKEGRI